MTAPTRHVPMADVAWQHGQVRAELDDAWTALLDDPYCDGAPFVERLETAIADRFGGHGMHVVTTQSGLAAQALVLRALGIGPGDEVVTAPNSDLATTAAISHVGATFVLADLREGSFHLDPDAVRRAIGPRTKAVVAVHMYGIPAYVEEVRAVCEEAGVAYLEDAALALGAQVDGVPAGCLGEAGWFSFAPRKILGGVGNGGVALVRDPEVARRVHLLRGYGLPPARQDLPLRERHRAVGHEHLAEGFNLRLDGIHAAVVAAKWPHLDAWNATRARIAAIYDAAFADVAGIETPQVRPGVVPAWRNYPILLDDRDAVRAALHRANVDAAVLYGPPVHLQAVYRHLGLGRGAFPVAERTFERLLCLPVHPGMDEETATYVVDAVAAAVRA